MRSSVLLISLLMPAVAWAQVPTSQRDPCRFALEGKIAWNAQGDTRWAPANIEKLCKNGNREEPAKCFDRVMHGRLDWGGGTSWESQNVINLCQGSQNADATIHCFRGQMRAKIAWENAVANCAPWEAQPQQPQQPTQPAQPVVTPVAEAEDDIEICRNAVQGRIPWNAAGERRWSATNVDALCKDGVGDEPAQCFDRLMRGQVNWGGGTNWEWKNALDLCRGAQSANATITCFEGQIRARVTWENAITHCKLNGPGVRVDQMALCRAAVQGKIPWNAQGETNWSPANVDRLCKKGVRDEPAKCFERLMRGEVNWGGGTVWQWENAIDLCEGALNHRKTIRCFEKELKKGVAWKTAIGTCGKGK